MKYVVTKAPTDLPLTFADLATHIRISARDRDYVTALQRSAVAQAERYLDQSLLKRTIAATFDRDDARHTETGQIEFALPRGPLIAVTSVTDTQGDAVTYTQTRVGNSDRIRIARSNAYPITVIYAAGFGAAADIPADIINAIRLHVATLYAWREDVSAAAANPVYNLERFYQFASANTGVG